MFLKADDIVVEIFAEIYKWFMDAVYEDVRCERSETIDLVGVIKNLLRSVNCVISDLALPFLIG